MINVYLFGRIILGLYFIYNGYNHFLNLEGMAGYAASKKVPFPKVAIFGTGLLLFFGGATIMTGILMPIGILALLVFLLGVTFTMHAYWKIKDPVAKAGERINFSKNIALIGALLIIFSKL